MTPNWTLLDHIVRAMANRPPCSDGPDCLWCPAVAVEEMLREKDLLK